MTRRFLGGVNSTATRSPESEMTDSDYDVILAALLCALICVLGLFAVARCAWIRRIAGGSSASQTQANKGLKETILGTLPKVTFSGAEDAGKFFDCAICLAEFVAGDELRVLPKCGHGFHVGCIDTWLGSHPTCPSCRQILMVTRCKKCREVPAADRVSGVENESRTVAQRADQISRFLP